MPPLFALSLAWCWQHATGTAERCPQRPDSSASLQLPLSRRPMEAHPAQAASTNEALARLWEARAHRREARARRSHANRTALSSKRQAFAAERGAKRERLRQRASTRRAAASGGARGARVRAAAAAAATVNITFPQCNERAGFCTVAHDDPGCSELECCQEVCELDDFCCSIAWDEICIEDNIEVCENLRVPPPACHLNTGYCLQERQASGCSDPTCCAAVCAADAFCCEQGWDGLCMEEANESCNLLRCTSIAEACDQTHGSPGCNDVACCQEVCEEDAFCCNSEWDSDCRDAARDHCQL
uniref:SMB domain-containing protein n=1 Tax=Pyrodinium bahamense TaxID=73915 RepID=A0A7S0A4G3_9DINO|mmetsp:Transcript_2192/g.6192  ORF Transcript_2192/g.6192 Transcript_2192/m.6192 type:complete len:301 (+) Transcript_2192:104-1006(+)|eukprot:CAMPEP_0179065076 /NCGR_PEP_ID=MMETSP0796-20121207/28271_1 /TAXON_ID=73915 /ORGANISM="Pyrodinium bahamense, Strain pbaha01" /LENGTH=300 /DNA_ID=CAMNT_0020762031 /DNA_START=97 /DNA_END=999 /DNA_ORIENTATION=-